MIEFTPSRKSGEFPVDLVNSTAFNRLERHIKWFSKNAADYLRAFSRTGLIDLSRPRRIIDFGANIGTSTVPLAQLARANGSSLIALEEDPVNALQLANLNIIPPEQVIVGNGVDYLNDIAERGERFDLLTAFFLGPDYNGELIRRLIPAAQRARSSQSDFIVTSDGKTMNAVCDAFNDYGLDFTFIQVGDDLYNYKHFGLITSFKRSTRTII
jgi:hypothetical protein